MLFILAIVFAVGLVVRRLLPRGARDWFASPTAAVLGLLLFVVLTSVFAAWYLSLAACLISVSLLLFLPARGAHAARRPSASPNPIALENATEGCVRETYGALVAHRQANIATDRSIRCMMQTIATDETNHAGLAWDVKRVTPERADAKLAGRGAGHEPGRGQPVATPHT